MTDQPCVYVSRLQCGIPVSVLITAAANRHHRDMTSNDDGQVKPKQTSPPNDDSQVKPKQTSPPNDDGLCVALGVGIVKKPDAPSKRRKEDR